MSGLLRSAHSLHITRVVHDPMDEKTWTTGPDWQGFYTVRPALLGKMAALIFAQAEVDGATRVQLHYGHNRMVYTLAGEDYDMVPPPAPMNVDLVRALVRASGATCNMPGFLRVVLVDGTLDLSIEHHPHDVAPYIEIRGFTGITRLTPDGRPAVVARPKAGDQDVGRAYQGHLPAR